jgi:proteasome accessory factor B
MKKRAITRLSRPPLARMMKLHEALKAGSFPNCRKLARTLEVADKTIQRDLEFMRDQLGLPIAYDPRRHGYRYTEEVVGFPSVQVTEGEMMALFVAQKALTQYRGTPFERPLAAAFRKLTEGLKDQVSFDTANWEAFYSFRSAGVPLSDLALFEVIGKALRDSVRVRFRYRKLRSSVEEQRTVEPWHLACVEQQWYLLGRDLARDSVRTFALTRMAGAELTGERFQRPRDFSPAALLEGSFGVFSGGRPRRIRIRFDAFAAQLVRERQWHPSQKIREEVGGGLVLELRLGSLPEIHRWVLGWGEHARVLEPAELRRLVRASLVRALEAYEAESKA